MGRHREERLSWIKGRMLPRTAPFKSQCPWPDTTQAGLSRGAVSVWSSPLSLSPQGPTCSSRPTYSIGPAQERLDQAVCALELPVDKCARENSRGSGKGNPHFGKSNFVSLTLTLTGKIEEKSLNTSRRRQMMTSVEYTPASWVLFSVFLGLGCPGIAGAPNHAHPWPHSVLLQ